MTSRGLWSTSLEEPSDHLDVRSGKKRGQGLLSRA